MINENLDFHPLTLGRWDDFVDLFGERGAYGGCWCMWWRKTRKQFEQDGSEGNRAAMRSLVEQGVVPGILAYKGDGAIGWCSIAPREQYGSLERSPVLRRLDDEPVWSLVCLFVDDDYRREGVAQALVSAALEYAIDQGAEIVEAYPTTSGSADLPPVTSYMGFTPLFERLGFEICARPSRSKLVMRFSTRK
jgi:GNAT superfamily N-acetyltransferase